MAFVCRTCGEEKQKLKAQVRKLLQENAWLRKELTSTNQKLQDLEETVGQLEEDKTNLEFMNALKIYDNDTGWEENVLEKKPVSLSLPEEHDDDSAPNEVLSPTTSTQMSASANDDYEIPATLAAVHKLATEYASQGLHDAAILLCKQTLEDLEKTVGHEHPDVAALLNILALVYRDQKKYSEAENLLKETLAIRKRTLGENNRIVAANLNNLAVLHALKGKYREAEPLLKRALEIKERILGKDHPRVAQQSNNLALILMNQLKYDEAEQYYRNALEIYENTLGPDDPNVEKTRNNLASAYTIRGKYQEARLLYSRNGGLLYKNVLARTRGRTLGNANGVGKLSKNCDGIVH